MAPSSPLQQKSRDIRSEPDVGMSFVFPNINVAPSPASGGPPGDFAMDTTWEWLQAAQTDDPSAHSNHQWALGAPPGLPPSPGLPPRQGPPMPIYSTKPGPTEYLPGAPTLSGPGAGYYQQPQRGMLYSPSPSGSVQPLPILQHQTVYASQQQPLYVSQHQPLYAPQHQPAYPSQNQSVYPSQNQSAYPSQNQPAYPSQHQPAHSLKHTSHQLLPGPPPSHGMHMHVIPPTPMEKGKQRAERVETQSTALSPSLLLASLPPTRAEKGKARAMDVDSDALSPPLPTPHDKDTPVADSDGDSGTSDSTSDSTLSSAGSASGRWKDDSIAAATIVFKAMDKLLNGFCTTHNIPFSRAFKTYLRGHSVRAPGENPWNTYTKLHAHEDHTKEELARVGYTKEGFELLDAEEQQKLRAQCWKEFQQSFSSPEECNTSLDVFRQFSTCTTQAKGISIGKRRRFFDRLLNKLDKVVCCFFFFMRSAYLLNNHRPMPPLWNTSSTTTSFAAAAKCTRTMLSWICA